MKIQDHPDYAAMGIFAGYGEFDPKPYEVRTGHDGKRYAVFANSAVRDDFAAACPDLFKGCRPSSCGQFDNAFQID